MFYVLTENGDVFASELTLGDATRRLAWVVQASSARADQLSIVEVDESGMRIGSPLFGEDLITQCRTPYAAQVLLPVGQGETVHQAGEGQIFRHQARAAPPSKRAAKELLGPKLRRSPIH